MDLAASVRIKCFLIRGRLHAAPGDVALVIDSHFHGSQSRLHRRHLHAHGLRKDVPGIGNSDATFGVIGVDRPYGDRSRLYVYVPPNILFLLTHFSVTS